MSEVKGFFSEPLEPQRQPKNYDAWQAASLLVGLYGANAANYADDRRTRVRQSGNWVATRTWDLIASEIVHLLSAAPDCL
jgi:hypothetical protein